MPFKKAKPIDKALTKAKIIEALADETGLAKKDVISLLAGLADLACSQAPTGFTIPGIGKLVVVDRKKRMGRNPATGEAIRIKASRKVRITPLKAFKDAVLGNRAPAKKTVKRKTTKKAVKRRPAKKTTRRR